MDIYRGLRIGNVYDHPEEGPIRITSGAFQIDGRVSNHFHWVKLEDGEKGYGYGANWPDITDQYEILYVRRQPTPTSTSQITPLAFDEYDWGTIMHSLYREAGELAAHEARRTGGRGYGSGGTSGQVERLHRIYDTIKQAQP